MVKEIYQSQKEEMAHSFVQVFHNLALDNLMSISNEVDDARIPSIINRRSSLSLEDFALLISPAAAQNLEVLCQKSQEITQQRFGRVIRLFAPLYVSNECINNCSYCGFSRDNPILRLTLDIDQVVSEAKKLKEMGFRNILLVSGEHPKFVTNGYIEKCIRELRKHIPTIGLEFGPMETDEYLPLVQAGAEGLVVYQETYNQSIYKRMHTAGPKKNFDWRLETPERAYQSGFRRLGIGALFGLADWREEALCLAAHAKYLMDKCWKASVTVSFPRLRPCAGSFSPLTTFSDKDLVQLVAAFRLFLPDVGIVLSTREPASLRNGLFPLGITHTSAGSHTEPGGYTGAGKENLHHTVKGRQVEIANKASTDLATGQFEISDDRTPDEIAQFLKSISYEPVWKDWDFALGH